MSTINVAANNKPPHSKANSETDLQQFEQEEFNDCEDENQ